MTAVKKLMLTTLSLILMMGLSACDNAQTVAQATEAPAPTAAQSTINIQTNTFPEQERLYTFVHEVDGSIYMLDTIADSDVQCIVQVFDSGYNMIQAFPWGNDGVFIEPLFQDINQDGYTDLAVYIGGWGTGWHVPYIWNPDIPGFEKVAFEGSEGLSHYEIHDGYLMNWIRDGMDATYVQVLRWDGNTLRLESEEYVRLEE